MTHPPLTLVARSIAVDRGERRVIDDLSFALGAGEAVAVTGPNGAGKSTLLRAVAGLIPLAAGAITAMPDAAMHLVGHQNAIKLSLSVADNLAFWCAVLGGAANEARLEEALGAFRLLPFAETPAEFLSQGQRRRLALARLLAAPRRIWLLDEPTAGLDAASRDRFAAILRTHVDAGGIVLAATHEPLGLPVRELRLAAEPQLRDEASAPPRTGALGAAELRLAAEPQFRDQASGAPPAGALGAAANPRDRAAP